MNGKQHGKGILTLPGGDKKEGLWEHGKRIKWLDEVGSQRDILDFK
jgi:hypothetical protein